ncbi:SAM-dependent methyltransferase [Salirhabdus sp. Marseille-P4669]|uniref:SAM-dependent methyltransferase n=1 Tax=Salirhabdus sp. Marseille-P4669 TaxID=2042310 RepID=UPI001356E672|nr:SAM-dependent methyltransferase [Salirhabdus sp. Marseille-P4669]
MINSVKTAIARSHLKSIPYNEFISLALYDSLEGYYNQKRDVFGKKGDFFTASHVHSVFCELLGEWFLKLFNELHLPHVILELGGGDGRFAKQLCEFFSNKGMKITYYFVEGNEIHRKNIKEQITNHTLETFSSLHDFEENIGHFNGIIYSNEFFDAQPVKVVEKNNGELFEVYVSMDDDGRLIERFYPCSREMVDWIRKYGIVLSEGHRMEVPNYLNSILEQIATVLHKGIILTIDYGYTNEELVDPRRKKGSLRGYLDHQMVDRVTDHVGKMDITHHIHWDSFIKIGLEHDLDLYMFEKQQQFLLQIGILDYVRENKSGTYFSTASKQNRAIQQLISGDFMGNMFEVCIQAKGIRKSQLEIFMKK